MQKMQTRLSHEMGKIHWLWVPAMIYLLLIHIASSGKPEDIGLSLPLGVDKLAHFIEFGILALLFWRPFRDVVPEWPELKVAALLFAFVALNGVIDEVHQSLTPGRTSSWADALADMTGGAFAIAWLLHRNKGQLN